MPFGKGGVSRRSTKPWRGAIGRKYKPKTPTIDQPNVILAADNGAAAKIAPHLAQNTAADPHSGGMILRDMRLQRVQAQTRRNRDFSRTTKICILDVTGPESSGHFVIF